MPTNSNLPFFNDDFGAVASSHYVTFQFMSMNNDTLSLVTGCNFTTPLVVVQGGKIAHFARKHVHL